MKHFARLWGNMLARKTLSMVLCLTLAVTSGGVCIASTTNLVQETKAAEENDRKPEGETKAAVSQEMTEAPSETDKMEGEALRDDINGMENREEEPEDTRCIHEFSALWVGYECKLTDYVEGYEPGDEVRISASFNKIVTSQIGLYIDGAWNSFRGEGKKRNITLVPDSDYLNIQISDMKGASSVNLTEISVEIVRKGEADTGSYLHRFTGLWQGFETKFSDFNPDYEPGDEIRVTVNFSKYVSSQLGMNISGQWSTLTGEGKEISKEVTPDNDYLNIQITDMWANYKVGVVSVSVEILKKGPGGSGYGSGGRLMPTRYTEPGDYLLFSGEANGKYETNDGWILDCADTDWITLRYSCVEDHENWGILGWGATVDGEWVDGPGYSADSKDSTKEVTQTFSVKYLRRMMKITEESNVSYLNLGSYSDGKIQELTLHVGSEIPRERSLFKDGDPNQAWVCTDIERILDAPDDKYLCVQYRCAISDFNGWTILSWGASVDGEWRNGKSYKASYKEANREQFFSMRMDAFRSMLHLSWDVKVDTIQLQAYNNGQIMDIWISDEKVTDPGEEKRVRPDQEGKYRSSNTDTYVDNINQEGKRYPQDIDLGPWGWTAGDNSLDHEQDIIDQISEGTYLVVEYEADKENVPNLQFTVVDERCENGTKQQQVTPTYIVNGQALFAYRDIQSFLSNYLIPHEVKSLQISAQDGDMSIKAVRIVKDDRPLEDEPIAVLTKSWGTYGTEISRWHSDYEVGDTVKVTVTFDKSAPGTIAFTIGGVWEANGYADSQTIIRTGRPDNDHMDIQIGQMPDYKSYVKITDIKVEIPGKKNFNEYVAVEGKRSAGILASTMREAATAILSDDEIDRGIHTTIVLEESALTEEEKTQVMGRFDEPDSIRIAKVSDVQVYKEAGKERIRLSQTDDPVRIKVPVPNDLRRSQYDFAVMRLHNGEWTFLEDLDGNTDTVTFASDKFSKFVMIYGEPGAFDQQSGALKVFRGEWSGWETSFSTYNKKYQAGKETKVTLTFDKEVGAYMDYHNPDWTRTPGDGEEVWIGKTFTRTIKPSDDSLTIGIANLNGNSTVKLLHVKVEQDSEKITSFTAADERFVTSFSAFYEKFVKGNPVTLKLTFDKAVVGSVGYYKDGTGEEVVESGSGASMTFTQTFAPGDDVLNLWITDMNGNSSVNLLDIEIVQNVTPLYIFRHCWGVEGDQYSGNIADLCNDYEPGDKVEITAVLDKSSQVKMNVDSGGADKEILATGVRISLMAVSEDGGFCIQAGDDSKLPLGLLDVSVKIVEKAPEEEALFSFTKAWGGDPQNEYVSTFSQHMKDGAEFKTNTATTLKLTFDETVGAKLQNYGGDGVEEEGNNKMVQFEIIPTTDHFMVQVTSIPSKGKVNLKSVEVIQEEVSGDFVYKYTKLWEGLPEELRNKYMENIEPEKEAAVKLTFDKAVKAEIRYNGSDGYHSIRNDSPALVIEEKITPWDNYFDVVLAEGEVPAYLLTMEVSQDPLPETVEHEFTGAWAGYETTFSKYNPDFVLGRETTVVLTFDQEVNKAQVACKTITTGWATTAGAGKTVTLSMTPNQDYMNVQITDMQGQTSIKLISIEVKQDASESEHEFTSAWDGYETSFVKYNSNYVPNSKTTVVLTFDQEVKAQAGYHTSADSGWTSKEGEGKTMSLDLDNPAPPDDYLNIQITDMKGNERINLLSVVVIQDFPEESAASFFLDEMILSEDFVHMFTEPDTIVLELSDYYDEYEPGQGVEVEMRLFSDGNFFVKVEDADFVTATASNAAPSEEIPSVEEGGKAEEFDAEPAVATKSDAKPAKSKTKAGENVNSDSGTLTDMPETATDSNAEAEKATMSNGTLDITVRPASNTKTSKTLVYENDEDGTLTVWWSGNPQSGSIAVTIVEMDGTQVNIDTVEVEEKENAVSVKTGVMSATKKLSAELCPSQEADFQGNEISLEQEPAKKEEDLADVWDGDNSQDPEMPDGKSEEPNETLEEEPEKDVYDILQEQEMAILSEADYSEREIED